MNAEGDWKMGSAVRRPGPPGKAARWQECPPYENRRRAGRNVETPDAGHGPAPQRLLGFPGDLKAGAVGGERGWDGFDCAGAADHGDFLHVCAEGADGAGGGAEIGCGSSRVSIW